MIYSEPLTLPHPRNGTVQLGTGRVLVFDKKSTFTYKLYLNLPNLCFLPFVKIVQISRFSFWFYIDHALRTVKRVDKVQNFTGLLLPVCLTFSISQKQAKFSM